MGGIYRYGILHPIGQGDDLLGSFAVAPIKGLAIGGARAAKIASGVVKMGGIGRHPPRLGHITPCFEIGVGKGCGRDTAVEINLRVHRTNCRIIARAVGGVVQVAIHAFYEPIADFNIYRHIGQRRGRGLGRGFGCHHQKRQ